MSARGAISGNSRRPSGVVVALGCIAGLLCLLLSGRSAWAQPTQFGIGHPMPQLEGQFLTGRTAALPAAAAGKVALVALGFTYAARVPVEAWGKWFRDEMGGAGGATFFEVPMLGGGARMGRWFIDSGMRKGTPKALHENVITVYGSTDAWKARLAVGATNKDAAFLLLIDQQGIVRWLHTGPFDATTAVAARRAIESLLAAPAAR